MSGSGPRQPGDISLIASDRLQRENKKINNERAHELKILRENLNARLSLQQEVMGEFRKADSTPLGGLVGKYMHLADLNVETLAGQTIAMILFDILSFVLQHEHGVDKAIYNKAGATTVPYEVDAGVSKGLAFDGSQTIYKIGADDKPDFDSPYMDGEDIPEIDIYKNGYIPEASLKMGIMKELGQCIQGASGVKPMGKDLAIQMFGVNAAEEVYKKNVKKHGDDASDLAAQAAARPPKLPSKL